MTGFHCLPLAAVPDAMNTTAPKDLPLQLDTLTGQKELEILLASGFLYLSPQACFRIRKDYSHLQEKLKASHSLLAHTFIVLHLSFEPTSSDGEQNLTVAISDYTAQSMLKFLCSTPIRA